MTDFKTKAEQVKAAGIAERGNFQPHGAPLRLYNYWLEHSKSKKAYAIRWLDRKENFCHFWRVVVIWAPLMALVRGFKRALPVLSALLLAGGLVALIVACIMSTDVLVLLGQVTLFLIGCAAVSFGLLCGVSAGNTPDDRLKHDLFEDRRVITAGFIVGLPGALISYTITWAVRLYNRYLLEHTAFVMVFLAGAAIAGILAFTTVVGGWQVLVTVLALAAWLLAVFALASWAGGRIAERLAGQRALAAQERIEYYEEHGEFPEDAEREPGRIARFFSGVGDFLILATQIVRVNKWKICPLVEVDKPETI